MRVHPSDSRSFLAELLAHRALNPPPSSSLAEESTPPLPPPPCGGARFPTLAAREHLQILGWSEVSRAMREDFSATGNSGKVLR